MSHKVVDKRLIESLNKQIENMMAALKEAGRYREWGETEAIKSLLRGQRSQLQVIIEQKDAALLACTQEGDGFARYLLGKQKQIQDIIESFENADKWEARYRDEITRLERERDDYAKLPAA